MESLSLEEFKPYVKQALEENIDQNQFYALTPLAEICVQVVKSGTESVSYRIIKTPARHAVQETFIPCDYTASYDFAVKFTSWNSFQNLITHLTCENIEQTHQTKGVYVLPSKYVLKGFKTSPGEDYTSFCPALSQCLTSIELSTIGISC